MHIGMMCRKNKGATNVIGLVGSIGIGALAILYLMGY